MQYDYKIEVECQRVNGKYGWSVLRKPTGTSDEDYTTCAIGLSNYVWDAFNDALYCKNRLEKTAE